MRPSAGAIGSQPRGLVFPCLDGDIRLFDSFAAAEELRSDVAEGYLRMLVGFAVGLRHVIFSFRPLSASGNKKSQAFQPDLGRHRALSVHPCSRENGYGN